MGGRRFFEKVPVRSENPVKFAFQHLPMIQKLFAMEDSAFAALIKIPVAELHSAGESTEDVPQSINDVLNQRLMEHFDTANICWIALNTWVREGWGEPDEFAEDTEFSCSYVHTATSLEIICESNDGFHVGINSQGIILKGLYRFDQMEDYFDLLDKMASLPEKDWVTFWKRTHGEKVDDAT